ncbi:MAG: acyl-CoA dehydrogenase family protein [Chloroflexota bacterium]
MTQSPGAARLSFKDSFGLTDDQDLFRRTVREFAEGEIMPIAAEHDESGEFPHATIKGMADLGLFGLTLPEEYGGVGAGPIESALAMEEIARADATHSLALSVSLSLVSEPILKFGTAAQKDRYLPRLASGEWLGSYCLSEPGSGSDAAGMQARATRDGDDWILNGTKAWISNAGEAGLYLVYAISDPSKAKGRNVSAFLIEADNPGLRLGAPEKKLGIRASTTSLVFLEDCRVAADAVLGEVDLGFRIAMATLDAGRIGIAAQALGIAQRALDESITYAKDRRAFDKPIADFQAIQWMLADMALKVEASRLLILRAARLRAAGLPITREASMAKLHASEAANFCADRAVQIHGGYGYSREYPVEKLFRDARITTIYEGTSEIQRLVISRQLLAN